jgi:hypothetical protein
LTFSFINGGWFALPGRRARRGGGWHAITNAIVTNVPSATTQTGRHRRLIRMIKTPQKCAPFRQCAGFWIALGRQSPLGDPAINQF